MSIRVNRRQFDAIEAGETAMSEDDLLRLILDLAKLHGWRAYHQRPARTKSGWRTACQGSAGFPDLVLARNRVLFAELKREGGRLTLLQEEWVDVLRSAGQEVHVWHPKDWKEIEKVLK